MNTRDPRDVSSHRTATDDLNATVDGTAVIDQAWPYDGPYTPDSLREAAAAIAHLTRYLINALQSPTAIAHGPDLSAVLGGLAATSLPTLLRYLATVADRVATDPTLYDDRRDRPGSTTAVEVALVLGEDTYAAANSLARYLDEAAGLASHLGHDLTDTDNEGDR